MNKVKYLLGSIMTAVILIYAMTISSQIQAQIKVSVGNGKVIGFVCYIVIFILAILLLVATIENLIRFIVEIKRDKATDEAQIIFLDKVSRILGQVYRLVFGLCFAGVGIGVGIFGARIGIPTFYVAVIFGVCGFLMAGLCALRMLKIWRE